VSANLGFALDSGWQVLLVALVLGAGLPVVFALGIRALAWGTGGAAERAPGVRPHPAGRVAAVVCFAVVVLAVALGITVVVSSGLGKAVSFNQGYPTLEDA